MLRLVYFYLRQILNDFSFSSSLLVVGLEDRCSSARWVLRPEARSALGSKRKPVLLTLRQATMATDVRQELAQLMNSTGSHKDLAAK